MQWTPRVLERAGCMAYVHGMSRKKGSPWGRLDFPSGVWGKAGGQAGNPGPALLACQDPWNLLALALALVLIHLEPSFLIRDTRGIGLPLWGMTQEGPSPALLGLSFHPAQPDSPGVAVPSCHAWFGEVLINQPL